MSNVVFNTLLKFSPIFQQSQEEGCRKAMQGVCTSQRRRLLAVFELPFPVYLRRKQHSGTTLVVQLISLFDGRFH